MGWMDGALGALLSGNAASGSSAGPNLGALGGLVSGLAGGASATPAGNADPMLSIALGLMQQHGGLTGLLGTLQKGGLGDHAQSWVGTGPNQPVTGAQLASALGPQAIAAIASQLGVPHGQASDGLAAVLPQLVSHMTPQGQVPGNHADILASALAMLGGAAR